MSSNAVQRHSAAGRAGRVGGRWPAFCSSSASMKTAIFLIVSLLALGCASAPSAPATSSAPTARDLLPQIEHERIGYHIDRWTGEKRAEFAGYLANKAQ